ncbi:hypothetical protein HELRODRAFT_182188 [Helobdella robusta]|uniref:Clu domain-containing protein n=1 Tax=Helobdella robusta TaxID=6412 RepID=T1FHW6_HELRO|nr:hypothetical protein HELRODRAFT_182188 [Helobdella robusta]ESN91216.1 hypothetical protein HELRODRAFT_182188 [Helobdella robusta]
MATDVINGQSFEAEIKNKIDDLKISITAVEDCPYEKLVNGVCCERDSDVVKDDDDEKPTTTMSSAEEFFIQESGFNIKIQAPGLDIFEIPVSSMELVQEIYQVLVDKEETCHRTCFTLQLDGVTLDNFSEVKSVEGLKEGSLLKVVEELYTVREARIHVRHIRDVLKSIDIIDAYLGNECNSLSLLNVITGGNILERKQSSSSSQKNNSGSSTSSSSSDQPDHQPPDYLLPGSKDRPLLPLHPVYKELKVVRMVIMMSTIDVFNPKPVQPKHVYHSLVDLLNQISPLFKKNFQLLLKKRQQKHPFERVATPYQLYNWMAPVSEHVFDYIRSEDAFSSRLGYEEHIPGQTRDWNEELQTTRELPRKHLPERLIRERTIFKVHSDFVVAATRGAMLVIDGNIMAINPGEDTKMQMFLWNNIFLSLGFDVKDHFKEFGGDFAAYAAPGCDLQGVKAYTSADIEGLYTLGTVVIDYRGYRMKKAAQSFKIRPHKVLNSKDEEIELYSSVECKGIIGNDNRHYVLDLLRTFPPDVHFLPVDPDLLSQPMKELGFPRKHRHKLACLRQELVDAFVENKYLMFVRSAAGQFQALKYKKMQEQTQQKDNSSSNNNNNAPSAATAIDENLVKTLTDVAGELSAAATAASAAAKMSSLAEAIYAASLESPESIRVESSNNNDVGCDDRDSLSTSTSSSTTTTAAAAAAAATNDTTITSTTTTIFNDTSTTDASDDTAAMTDTPKNDTNTNNNNIVEGSGDVLCSSDTTSTAATTTAAASSKVCCSDSSGDNGVVVNGSSNNCGGGGGDDGSCDHTKEIVVKAAKLIGSLNDNEFTVLFNTDLFQEHVRHPDENTALKYSLILIYANQIAECLEHASSPIDHFTLTEALHNRFVG